MTTMAALYARLESTLGARAFQIMRYLVSGGTAAASNILIFYVLVHSAGLYYLHASILAFLISIIVSFTMQKFWTFRDALLHDAHRQFARYLVVIAMNLVLNTALMYVLVEYAALWHVLAQVVTTAIIAIVGYFGYRHFVFRQRL